MRGFLLSNTGALAASATKNYHDIDISLAVPSGYTPICAIAEYPGDDQFVFVTIRLSPENGKLDVTIRNVGTDVDSGTPSVAIISVINQRI